MLKFVYDIASLAQNLLSFLENGPSMASFSFIFVFSNKHHNFYNK